MIFAGLFLLFNVSYTFSLVTDCHNAVILSLNRFEYWLILSTIAWLPFLFPVMCYERSLISAALFCFFRELLLIRLIDGVKDCTVCQTEQHTKKKKSPLFGQVL